MKSSFGIIVAREYRERVRRKSFIITTLLMPLFMVGLMMLPGLITVFASPQQQVIAVVDDSGIIGPELHSEGEIRFSVVNAPMAELKNDETYDAFLVIGPDVVSLPATSVALYSRDVMAMPTEQFIRQQVEQAVEKIRIRAYNIDNLSQILDEIKVEIPMPSYRIDKDEENAVSSTLSYLLGISMMFILYMFILLYGQMVMNSIIEEKNNRVLELVVSSVRPNDLLLGKIVGIGAVAFTQIIIWVCLLLACSLWVMPSILGMASGADASLVAALGLLGNVAYMGRLLFFLVIFLIGGYLLYSSIYAAIGSAVDNIQDASQIQTFALVPIILAFMVSMAVVNDPNSELAFWTSIIPFTSPMVMMARMPFDIPVWQAIVSAVVLYASFFGMIWISAKIYRVGIFMYGKKPTIGELIRWARYK